MSAKESGQITTYRKVLNVKIFVGNITHVDILNVNHKLVHKKSVGDGSGHWGGWDKDVLLFYD